MKNRAPVETHANLKESMYASLPRSMKSEVLVRSRLEDPEVLKERQRAVQTQSVSELARVSGLSDMPVPATIENIMHGKWKKDDDK